jgi:hypothetical protein
VLTVDDEDDKGADGYRCAGDDGVVVRLEPDSHRESRHDSHHDKEDG